MSHVLYVLCALCFSDSTGCALCHSFFFVFLLNSFNEDEIANQWKNFVTLVLFSFLYWTWYTVCILYNFVLWRMSVIFNKQSIECLNAAPETFLKLKGNNFKDFCLNFRFYFLYSGKKAQIWGISATKSHTNNNYPQIKLKNIIQNISGNTVK